LPDAIDGGHENDSEEAADIEDQKLFSEGEGEGEKKEDGDREENVAADFGAGSLLVRGEVFGRRVGQPISPWNLLRGADCWMQIVCSFGLGCGSAEFESGLRWERRAGRGGRG
jgi:hypothetical protein